MKKLVPGLYSCRLVCVSVMMQTQHGSVCTTHPNTHTRTHVHKLTKNGWMDGWMERFGRNIAKFQRNIAKFETKLCMQKKEGGREA